MPSQTRYEFCRGRVSQRELSCGETQFDIRRTFRSMGSPSGPVALRGGCSIQQLKCCRVSRSSIRWSAYEAIAILAGTRPNCNTVKAVANPTNSFKINRTRYVGFDLFP